MLAGCGGGNENAASSTKLVKSVSVAEEALPPGVTAPAKDEPTTEMLVAAGEHLFKDPNLSASKKMACASCHAENAGHADKLGTKLPLGGPLLTTAGMPSSPTVRYLNENTAFSIDKQGLPSGGFTWDGRADSRKEQAGSPFFEHQEMALPGSMSDPKALTALVRAADYYGDIQKLYKAKDIDTDAKLFDKITTLIETYQREDKDYNRFDSRYDMWLQNKGALTPARLRGMALFKDTNRGNCISCHSAQGEKQLFTNFGYASLAAPRNHEEPKNADASYFDLGLCMRERATSEKKKQAAADTRYCGMFKTPTLRNIDRTAPYFHNASVPTLEAAVRFHFERDTQPSKYYRRADGTADRAYNDLPAQHLANVAKGKPFDGSYSPTDSEIGDLLAFLKTLNDADQVTLP